MIVRATTHRTLLLLLAAIALALITHCPSATARPLKKDSPVKTIIVPYQPNIVRGKPYQFPKAPASGTRQVLVPEVMELVPRFNLDRDTLAMGSQKGMPVNFADGAYPVYYMPGNANGKFNGKISLLMR